MRCLDRHIRAAVGTGEVFGHSVCYSFCVEAGAVYMGIANFHRAKLHQNSSSRQYCETLILRRVPIPFPYLIHLPSHENKSVLKTTVFGTAMVKARCKAAGLSPRSGNHSFRIMVLTNLLENGGTLEEAQRFAGHADARTTDLYDRRSRAVIHVTVERINYATPAGPQPASL